MSRISKNDFIKMAKKILIDPTDDVILTLDKEYDEMNEKLKLLDKFDTTNVEPLQRLAEPITYLREDEIDENIILDKKTALKNADQSNKDYVIIKRIIK